jgi:hypothetical protein
MTQQPSSKGKQGNPTITTRESQNAANVTSQVTNQVKDTVGQVADQAQQAAGQVASQARQQVSSRLLSEKDRAAEGLTGLAQALRQTGQQLRDQDQQSITGYIDGAASQVDRVANYLKQNDIGGLIDDVERFARRQPALFLGGTFVLGLLGARFLKSSRPYTEPAAGLNRGTAIAQRQSSYYTSYPTESNLRGASMPNYGSSTQSGSTSTTGHMASERSSTGNPSSQSRSQRREQ